MLCDTYYHYEYDPDVRVILNTFFGMGGTSKEEVITALEGMGLGRAAMKDMEEMLGEFFIKHSADIFSHLQLLSWYQKKLTRSDALE